MADNFYASYPVNGGTGVTSLNGETGDINIVAGTGISVTPAGQNITIAATGGGDVTLTPVGSSPNANGASLSGQALTLQPANTSFPGVLLAADWNTFNNKQSTITIGTINSQVAVTDGLQLISNVLYAQYATATVAGMVSATAQTFGGAKTFNSSVNTDTIKNAAGQTAIDVVSNLLYSPATGNWTLNWGSNTLRDNAGSPKLSMDWAARQLYGTDGTTVLLDWNSASAATLTGNASTATRATNIAGGLGGSIPYQTAVNTTALLANGSAGQVLTSAGTTLAPTWATPTTGTVTAVSVATANGLAGSSSGGATPQLTLSTTVTGVLSGNGTAISAASTTGSGAVVLATAPTMSNPIVGTQSQGDSSTKAASTSYVDVAVANAVAGVNPAVAVQAATTAAGDTSGFTYNNGVSGIGATFTGSVNTAITIDGFTFTTLGQRLLVKNDTQSPSGAFNGVYYVTQVQTGILAPILTRALDYDAPSDMNNTGAIPVINGTVNGTTSWVLTSLVVTVGTTPLTFTEFTRNPADYLLKANNLSDVANSTTSFNNISGMTTLGDLIYGGTSGARSRLAGNTTTTLQALTQTGTGSGSAAPVWTSAVSTNTASTIVARDGSGNFAAGTITAALSGNATTATTATNATNIATTATNSTNATFFPTFVASSSSSNQGADTATGLTFNPSTNNLSTTTFTGALAGNASTVTTNANLTGDITSVGNATTYAGTVPLNKGGTGQTTKAPAFDALQPMTTGGDIIYGGASGTGTRLANGSAGQFLQSQGGTSAPTWAAASNLAVTSKTTTYAIATTDDVILVSGSVFTATLPTAVGVTGKQYKVIKTDSSTTNIVSLATTSSQTIGQYASPVHLAIQNEAWNVISDGTNWQIIDHYIPSVSFSCTWTGSWSTNTTYTSYCQRVGDHLKGWVKLAIAGAPTSATLTLTLPNSWAMDTTKQNTSTVNPIGQSTVQTHGGGTTYNGTVKYVNSTTIKPFDFSVSGAAVDQASITQAAPLTFASGDEIDLYFDVAISGWEG